MKKLMIFACSLMAGVSAYAQDVLITNNGDVKNVYEVEVGTNAVFYKSEDKADAAILRINKADVFMIKRKDGTKYDLGNGAQPSSATSSTPSPAQASSPAQQSAVASQGAPHATVSAASQKRREELIAYSNTYAPEYVGKKSGNAGLLYAVIGYGEDSQFNYYMRSIIGFPENIVFGGEDVKLVKYLPDYAKSMGFIGDVNGMMVKDKTTFPRK